MNWGARTFTIYQVNATGAKGFSLTEVVLDNHVDISIMRPELLQSLGQADREICIGDVGGVQLTVNTTCYL